MKSRSGTPITWTGEVESSSALALAFGSESTQDGKKRRYKFISDLLDYWQDIAKNTRLAFHEMVVNEGGFPLRGQTVEIIELLYIAAIFKFEQEGGTVQESEWCVDSVKFITNCFVRFAWYRQGWFDRNCTLFVLSYHTTNILQVWTYLATICNNVKAVAAIFVTMYPELSPPPGLSMEQQIQYTKDKVAILAGDDIQFTGEDYDNQVSTVNNDIWIILLHFSSF